MGDKNKADPKADVNPQSGTSNDRLFYTLPNFLTVQANQLPPLTQGKNSRWWREARSILSSTLGTVLLPASARLKIANLDSGKVRPAMAKRYGTSFADGTIENFMTGAILPSLLREDPRFYQLGTGTFWHRTGYAISRIFVTRTDSGHERFNFSEIIGGALSAGISTYSYHPRADRNLPNAASVWGTLVGYDTITIVVKEFWPDIRRKLSHKPARESRMP